MNVIRSQDGKARILYDPPVAPYLVFIHGTAVRRFETKREAKEYLERCGHTVHDWSHWLDWRWWAAIGAFLLITLGGLPT
jgi:hypothetical protein